MRLQVAADLGEQCIGQIACGDAQTRPRQHRDRQQQHAGLRIIGGGTRGFTARLDDVGQLLKATIAGLRQAIECRRQRGLVLSLDQ